MKLSDRIKNIEASATVRFTALLEQLTKQGREIIDFAVGEPQYDTPVSVVDATRKALEAQARGCSPALAPMTLPSSSILLAARAIPKASRSHTAI